MTISITVLCAIMLSVAIFYCYVGCHYAQCRQAECRRYAECRQAECRYAECRSACLSTCSDFPPKIKFEKRNTKLDERTTVEYRLQETVFLSCQKCLIFFISFFLKNRQKIVGGNFFFTSIMSHQLKFWPPSLNSSQAKLSSLHQDLIFWLHQQVWSK